MDNVGGAGYSALLFRARMVQYSTNERQAQGVATLNVPGLYLLAAEGLRTVSVCL